MKPLIYGSQRTIGAAIELDHGVAPKPGWVLTPRGCGRAEGRAIRASRRVAPGEPLS
jgi:hypothetical protein